MNVHITKRVETAKGLRFCPVVTSANKRIKPDVVIVDGQHETHTEGAYYIEWRTNGKRHRLSVGKSAQDAVNAQQRKEAELSAIAHGIITAHTNGNGNRRTLTDAITEYLSDFKGTAKPRTYLVYSRALSLFRESVSKVYLDELDRRDLLQFSGFMRNVKNQAPRSVFNKFLIVQIFLKAQGLRLVQKNDWPRFTEEMPEIYEAAELEALFNACTAEELLWFEFFLMTGMREQEVMHCAWSDVDLDRGTVRVTHKPQFHWTPKAYREREIPIPDALVEKLRSIKSIRRSLVFPKKDKPRPDFLDHLKAAAKRAGLEPADCWLHKFRSTFCTRHLWNGTDLPTVQSWMGHRDIKSTMRYVRPRPNDAATRAKVNSAF